jgi:hypothetical protein
VTDEGSSERTADDCASFDNWLDAGMPASGAATAEAHAAVCARCASALAAERAIAALLVTPIPAPAGFTERVMLRVDRAAAARARWRTPLRDAMPWWGRAAMQPSVLLAAAVAAVLVWRPDAIARSGAAAAGAVAAVWDQLTAGMGPGLARSLGARTGSLAGDPILGFGLMAALATLLALAALPLYRWTEHAAGSLRPSRPRGPGAALRATSH